MEAVMIVESEEFAPSSRGMIVADDTDSTPSSSQDLHTSLSTNQRKERRHRSPAKKRQLSKKKIRVSYRSLDQKKKLKHNAVAARKLKEASKFLAIKSRVDREEGVTPQKLRYLEELARENERERIRHEIIMQRMNAMQRDMQLMMAVAAQVGMTDDFDFIFDM